MSQPNRRGGISVSRPLSLAVLLAVWLAAAVAVGQPAPSAAPPAPPVKPEPSAADKETARNLVAIGDKKYEEGDFAGALKAYRGADAIMGVPTTGVEVGRTMLAHGMLVEARDKLLEVSRYPITVGEPEPFTQARERAAALADEVAARVPSLQIHLRGLSPGRSAAVQLDGELLEPETLGLPRSLNPGKHRLKVTAAGYQPVEITLELSEREARVIDVPLQPIGEPPPPPPKPGVSPLVFVGFISAGAGVIVGTVTGAMSLAQAGDVKDACEDNVCPTALETDADRSVALAHASTVSFIIAGAGAAVGVVGLLLSGSGDATEAAGLDLQPMVGPGSLGVRGTF